MRVYTSSSIAPCMPLLVAASMTFALILRHMQDQAADELRTTSWPLASAQAWLRLACRGLASRLGMPLCTARLRAAWPAVTGRDGVLTSLATTLPCRRGREPVPGGPGGGGAHHQPAGHGHAAQHICDQRGALHAAALARRHGAQECAGLPRHAGHRRRERQPPGGAGPMRAAPCPRAAWAPSSPRPACKALGSGRCKFVLCSSCPPSTCASMQILTSINTFACVCASMSARTAVLYVP